MLESTLAAARAVSARIVFPGTVYNFGPDAFPVLAESSPQRPLTRRARSASRWSGGSRKRREPASPCWRSCERAISSDLVPRAAAGSARASCDRAALRSVTYPGYPDVGHTWAYLPDLAATLAELLERSRHLERFDVFHFGGHWLDRGVEIAEAARRVAGVPRAPIRRLPWFAIRDALAGRRDVPGKAGDALPLVAAGPARPRTGSWWSSSGGSRTRRSTSRSARRSTGSAASPPRRGRCPSAPPA